MSRIALAALLIMGLPLWAQTPQSEAQTLSTLLSEVQRLRLAIERSTLLGARTQIAILLLQTQETRTQRISEDLERARKEISQSEAGRAQQARVIKDLEARLSDAATPPAARLELEQEVKGLKSRTEDLTAETQMRARETEVAAQLRSEQSRLTELQNQISEMERALDTAIRQTTGK